MLDGLCITFFLILKVVGYKKQSIKACGTLLFVERDAEEGVRSAVQLKLE